MLELEREIGYKKVEISGALFQFSFVHMLLGKIEMDQIDDVGKKEQNCQNNVLEGMGEDGNEHPNEEVNLSHKQRQFFHSIEEKAMYVVQMQAEKETAVGRLVEVILDNFCFL